MTKPLEGIRVIDMSHVIAGPLASFYLAQLGADVIKIESPMGGDVMRASKGAAPDNDTPTGFVAFNAGKRSLAVDIRTPQGSAAVRELARTADVFIENFRPGVVARYGLDYAAIKEVRPDVVYCSISAFGQQGNWAGRGAYDHVVQALTGMMLMSGDEESAPPIKVGFPVVDVAVGMLGALSISAALHRRARDGSGEYIDTSLMQASMMLMYPNATEYLTHGTRPQRVGNRGYTGSPTADTYRCADGWLATAANTPNQFRKLTRVLGMEALCTDAEALDLDAFNAPGGGFVVPRDLPLLRERFRDAFATRSAAGMEEQLNAVGVPAARVRTLDEFLDEAQQDGKTLVPHVFAQNGGEVRTPGLGFLGKDDRSGVAQGAPSLGQDTHAVLSELGLSKEIIDSLCEARTTASSA